MGNFISNSKEGIERHTCDSRDAQMNGKLLNLPTAFYIYQKHSGRVWPCKMIKGPEKYNFEHAVLSLKQLLNKDGAVP